VSSSSARAPVHYRHINSSHSLPMGGPLLYNRYEERPSILRPKKGPGAMENKIHAYYQVSDDVTRWDGAIRTRAASHLHLAC
jgi:hypothetical protein